MNDNCRTFDVDPLTREVVFPPDAGTIAVASDEAVRAIRIKVARAYHGVDLSEFEFRVNYVNAAGETGVQIVGVQEDSFGELTVEWVPRRHVTQAPGTVRFVLCAVRHGEDGLTVAQEFNTRIASFDVEEGLEVEGDAELEERLDWIWKVVADCEAATGAAGEAIAGIDARVDEACGEIETKLDEACARAEEEMRASEEDRALAELERAEAEAQRAAQFAIMEQKTRDWLRYICQTGEYDPDTGRPTIQEPKANVFYFVPTPTPTDESIYQEWMWVPEDERWESFGAAKLTVTPATPDQLAAVLDGTDSGEGGGEIVNLTGWRSVVPRLKAMFAGIVHKHSGADIEDGTITKAKLDKDLGDSLSRITTSNGATGLSLIQTTDRSGFGVLFSGDDDASVLMWIGGRSIEVETNAPGGQTKAIFRAE